MNKFLFDSIPILLISIGLLVGCGGDDTPTNSTSETELKTGTLEFNVSTNGNDIDEDGYTLGINGTENQTINTDETVNISNLEEGSYEVELSNLAYNCAVDGSNPQSLNITQGTTTTSSMVVECSEVADNVILYTVYLDGDSEIYQMNTDGSSPKPLTDDSNTNFHPDISPDGIKIAFAKGAFFGSSESQIYIMNADGSEPNQLTKTSGVRNIRPVWSPDGSRIAFTSDRDGDKDIYIVDADGSNLSRIEMADDQTVSDWSPDGDRLLLVDKSDGDREICSINPDGTGLVKLTDNDEEDDAPKWSNQGTKISYASTISGNSEIHIMNTDGSDVVQLTSLGELVVDSDWSADDSEIAFLQYNNDGSSNIYKVNADGSGSLMNLTNTSYTEGTFVWSPVK